jgi:hypothetical protein
MGLVLLTGGLILARPVAAQEPDLLKETQQRLKVEAERLEGVVADAIRTSDNIGRTQPTRAIAILKDAMAHLEADKEALKPERREVLARKLTLTLRAWSERADNPIDDRRLEELRRMRDDIARRLATQSKVTDGRIAGEDNLAARFRPLRSDTFLNARNRSLSLDLVRPRCAEPETDGRERPVPPMNELIYPPDWQRWIRMRSPSITVSDPDQAILKALDRKMSIEVENKLFVEVLDQLRAKTGQPIVVDERAMYDVRITYETPVTLSLRDVPTRKVLNQFLGGLGMTYVLKNQAIHITSIDRARETLTTRMYSVADLMAATGGWKSGELSETDAYATLHILVIQITNYNEPDSWKVNNKNAFGTITFDPFGFVFLVEQTEEMHYRLRPSEDR